MSPSVDVAQNLSLDSLRLESPLLTKSDSHFHEEEQNASALAIASANEVTSFTSVTRCESASYYKEYLRTTTLADCRLSRRGAILTAEWTNVQGVIQQSSLNLDFHVGNIDGTLRWGCKDFSKSCTKLDLRGTILSALCRHSNWGGPEGSCYSELDLNQCIYISGGVLCAVAHVDFSDFMSEASWMNFKVVAEPNIEMLFDHPAFRGSVSGIAERAVAHVMEKTQTVLQAIITEALEVIQESAKEYIESEIRTIEYTAHLHKSQSEHSKLRIFRDQDNFRRHEHKAEPKKSRYNAINGAVADGLHSGEHSRRNSNSSEEIKEELESIQYDSQVADASTDGLLERTVADLDGGVATEIAEIANSAL